MTTEKDDSSDVSFSLLENGLDFVLSAIEHLSGTPSKRQLKYAVLHLYSGTVLILKERLLREDRTLLFANPEKADEETFEKGDFHGPNLDQCIQRLEELGVKISDDRRRQLQLIANKRKRLEHFRFADSAEAVIALTADIVNFLIDFISSELDTEGLDEADAEILETIRGKLAEFQAYVDERWRRIQSEVESAETVVACAACLEEAWAIGDEVICFFCGYRIQDGESAAEEYIMKVLGEDRYRLEKDGGEWPRYKCPACDSYSLVDLEYVERGPRFICFACGTKWDLDELGWCSHCNQPYAENGMSICDDCFEARVRADD